MQIITRAQWGANPRSLPTATMRLPAVEIFVHHSVTTVTDYPIADMRSIEQIGMSRFNQFSYSYVIHPRNGEILEGCGLRRGAHTAEKNSTSFGICWAGNYETRAPKVQQIESTRWLIAELTRQGHLKPGAQIRGHRDTGFATACPGAKLYAVLNDIRVPYAPSPAPVPAPRPATPPVEVDVNLRAIALSINLDNAGKGWTTIPYPIERVVGHLAHSGTRPGADGRYDGTPDTVGFTPQENETLVVVQGGNPGGTAPVWIQVIEN